jgi:hypothetical protein
MQIYGPSAVVGGLGDLFVCESLGLLAAQCDLGAADGKGLLQLR